MFRDKVALAYDLFEDIYNGRVYWGTGQAVAGEICKDGGWNVPAR